MTIPLVDPVSRLNFVWDRLAVDTSKIKNQHAEKSDIPVDLAPYFAFLEDVAPAESVAELRPVRPDIVFEL